MRIDPGEILLSDTLYDDEDLRPSFEVYGAAQTPLPPAAFDSVSAERRMKDYFAVASLDAFGSFSRAEVAACGAIVDYVERTQMGERPPLSPPARQGRGQVMAIDAATRANLELVRMLGGQRKGSLLATVDRTVTAAGGRELARRLSAPLTDETAIGARLDAVEAFVEAGRLREDVRWDLRAAPDLARALSRIAMDRGGPRDLKAIGEGIEAALAIVDLLSDDGLPEEVAELRQELGCADASLAGNLAQTLSDEPPLSRRDGGFVREGFSADLDEARALRDESRKVIAALQGKYQEETGIRSLKVRHNNVLGYYVEVTAQHGEAMLAAPLNETFIHRQTMANALRFSTVALGDLESRIARAADQALALELKIFDGLVAAVTAGAETLKQVAGALGVLDVHTALAELAVMSRYCRPQIDDSLAFDIRGGRHAVVERALQAEAQGPFVANDCALGPDNAEDAGHIWLVTGPNMAGKSTFLRQNALIAILAQAGSFVPADTARIGVVDRLFSRVGAADDLARGRSTFMVEMVETAAILNQAGRRALVILDEIGRGTATFDGLSIAWAAVEHLHAVNCCRSLFATHFHELTALSLTLERLDNVTVRVKEWEGEVIFLHEVAPGAADRSYGIQVANLAGLPSPVIERARAVLDHLESDDRERGAAGLIDDLPLFTAEVGRQAVTAKGPQDSEIRERIGALAPDDMAPRDALEALYALKAWVEDGGGSG